MNFEDDDTRKQKTVDQVVHETIGLIMQTSLETGIPFTDENIRIAQLVARIAVSLDRKGG